MERASKILMFVFFLGATYFAWSIFTYSPEVEGANKQLAIEGKSMEPTFHDGQIVQYSVKAVPKSGDIIYFDCLVEKCHHQTVAHRLIAVSTDGCMTIEGDNQPISFDTKDYGCLMPRDIHINGVILDK